MYFCQKNQQFWFSSFFTTTSIRGWFLANLATLPPPHGSPHPTTHLTTYLYVFCVQRAQKPCLIIKIQLLLHFSKVGGGKSILAFFGLWWPSFSATGSPGVAQKCQTRVSPCYTYGNPCQNICRACSINFMQFLNTPLLHGGPTVDQTLDRHCLIFSQEQELFSRLNLAFLKLPFLHKKSAL